MPCGLCEKANSMMIANTTLRIMVLRKFKSRLARANPPVGSSGLTITPFDAGEKRRGSRRFSPASKGVIVSPLDPTGGFAMASLLLNFRNTMILSVVLAIIMLFAFSQSPHGMDQTYWQAVFR